MTIKEAGKKVNITMTRGDSESLTVTCSVPFANGDTVYFTVREDAESEILLQKVIEEFPDGAAVIPIYPEDTEGMDFGNYVYDLQVTWADGTVKTVIDPSSFRLNEEVTY
jgi:hypothetical protein